MCGSMHFGRETRTTLSKRRLRRNPRISQRERGGTCCQHEVQHDHRSAGRVQWSDRPLAWCRRSHAVRLERCRLFWRGGRQEGVCGQGQRTCACRSQERVRRRTDKPPRRPSCNWYRSEIGVPRRQVRHDALNSLRHCGCCLLPTLPPFDRECPRTASNMSHWGSPVRLTVTCDEQCYAACAQFPPREMIRHAGDLLCQMSSATDNGV
jgi:hypothetical protein